MLNDVAVQFPVPRRLLNARLIKKLCDAFNLIQVFRMSNNPCELLRSA